MDVWDPWLPILQKLPLSRAEEAVVKRYASDPQGRAFLPISDILRQHKLIDESVEILVQGVERHPAFTVARVILARELFLKGLCEDAWMTLESCREPLHENVLAQRLRLKLAIILRQEADAHKCAAHLKAQRMLDEESSRLNEGLELMQFAAVREMLVKDLRHQGIPILDEILAPPAKPPSASQADTKPSNSPPDSPSANITERLLGFHVLPLREVFATAWGPEGDVIGTAGGVELDSITLAEIYEQQGHYQKALEVNRRLLRLMPSSEMLKRKVAEISRLKAEQRAQDLAIDPEIVDKMTAVEDINQQISFLEAMLGRL